MQLLEVIFSLTLVAILASGAYLSYSLALPNDARSALTTLYALKRARLLSLTDSSYMGYVDFGDIYAFARVDSVRLLSSFSHFFWQTQFHTSGIYTKNSLSIYRDTPRFASTTDFDKRPLAGDIVALSAANQQCLSGYNNTNITGFCKDNALLDFRLFETNRLQNLALGYPQCQERDTFRFYFDDFSRILCGINLQTPTTSQVVHVGNFSILLNPITGYAFILK